MSTHLYCLTTWFLRHFLPSSLRCNLCFPRIMFWTFWWNDLRDDVRKPWLEKGRRGTSIFHLSNHVIWQWSLSTCKLIKRPVIMQFLSTEEHQALWSTCFLSSKRSKTWVRTKLWDSESCRNSTSIFQTLSSESLTYSLNTVCVWDFVRICMPQII